MQMRKTLEAMNEQLTPYSGKVAHQRYLDSLKHYKMALNNYMSRANEELDRSIHKSYEIIKGYIITDINNIKKVIIDGR